MADLAPGTGGSAPGQLVLAGDQLFLAATTLGTGREPHVMDVGALLRFHEWTEAAGLSGLSATAGAIPFGDGVANLLKFAFGMDGAAADRRVTMEGAAGLPRFSIGMEDGAARLRVEYLMRDGSGLRYTPMRSESLEAGSFMPMGGTETVETLAGGWLRVVRSERLEVERCFGVVEVSLP